MITINKNDSQTYSFHWSKALCYMIPITAIILTSALFTVWTNGFWVDALLLAPSVSGSTKILFLCLVLLWGLLWLEERQVSSLNKN